MPTSELVTKLMEEMRKKSSLHSLRKKNSVLNDFLRPKSNQFRNRKIQTPIRFRFTPKTHLNTNSNTDFFTRLVNSSPKPPVLRSIHHPVSLHLMKLSQSSNYRTYRGLVLLSSLKLIKEYCERNGPCNRIYTTNHSNELLSDPSVKFDKVLIVSKKLLQKIGKVHSYNKGLLAEVPYPEPSESLGIPRLVLCICPSLKKNNRISNSDLGSIVRSAQALQWQAVWLLQNGNIDLLDPLSIRSSQFTLSTIPYSRGKIEETLKFVDKNNLMLCHCAKGGLPLHSPEFSEKLKLHNGLMLMIGNLPFELYSKSTKISVMPTGFSSSDTSNDSQSSELIDSDTNNITNSDFYPLKSHKYTLDDHTQTSIAMYIIKRDFFKDLPRSPFISI